VTAIWVDDSARERMRLLILAEAERLASTSVTTLQVLEGLAELRARVRKVASPV
jgi:hypothetical protein